MLAPGILRTRELQSHCKEAACDMSALTAVSWLMQRMLQAPWVRFGSRGTWGAGVQCTDGTAAQLLLVRSCKAWALDRLHSSAAVRRTS